MTSRKTFRYDYVNKMLGTDETRSISFMPFVVPDCCIFQSNSEPDSLQMCPKPSAPAHDYFPWDHPSTKRTLRLFLTANSDEISRLLARHPQMFMGKYFQILDYPDAYDNMYANITDGHHINVHSVDKSLRHAKSVLYLTPVALAIYLKREMVLDILVSKRTSTDRAVYVDLSADSYATEIHCHGKTDSDIRRFPNPCLAVDREFYEALPYIISLSVWVPTASIELIYRRRYDYRVYEYLDIIDYAMRQLLTKPCIRLARMIKVLAVQFRTYNKAHYDIYTLRKMVREKDVEASSESDDEDDVGEYVGLMRRCLRFSYQEDQYSKFLSSMLDVMDVFIEDQCMAKIILRNQCITLENRIAMRRAPSHYNVQPGTQPNSDIAIHEAFFPVILDQDNSLILFWGIMDKVRRTRHYDRMLAQWCELLIQTGWLEIIRTTDLEEIIEYYTGCNEDIPGIRERLRWDIERFCEKTNRDNISEYCATNCTSTPAASRDPKRKHQLKVMRPATVPGRLSVVNMSAMVASGIAKQYNDMNVIMSRGSSTRESSSETETQTVEIKGITRIKMISKAKK